MEPDYSALSHREKMREKYQTLYDVKHGEWLEMGAHIKEFENYMSLAQLRVWKRRRSKIGKELKQIRIQLQLLN